MVEFVRDDEAAFAYQRRKPGGIRAEPHGEDHCRLLACKTSNLLLNFEVKVGRAHVPARRAEADTVLLDGVLDGIGTRTLGLREPEVVVGAHVERLRRRPSQLEVEIIVVRLSVDESDETPRYSGDRSCEAVVQPHLQTSHVEIVKVAVQRRVTVSSLQVRVSFLSEPLAEKVSDVPEDDQDEVADVGCEKIVVGRFVNHHCLKFSTMVPADVSMAGMAQGSELCVLPCNSTSLCR